MCFGGAKPKPTPAPPTERDANLEGVRDRARANAGTSDRNMLTGMNGVSPAEAGGQKSILGAG